DPILAHLDEQEEVDAAVEHLFKLGAGAGADRLDAPPALAEDDRPLARPLNIDHLLDAGAAVAALLPAFGLDRRGIRQLVMELQEDLLAGRFGGKPALLRIGQLI